MQFKKITILLVPIITFLLCTSVTASAIEEDKVQNTLSVEENIVISNTKISVVNAEEKATIKCFDISDKGLIAIGLNTSPKKINVYNSEGVFQYGYVFSCAGSFGVQWNNDTLQIYLVRSDLVLSVDSRGQCIAVDKLDNNRNWRKTVFSSQRMVNGKTYYLESDMGILTSSYSRLVVTDNVGNTRIIYDSIIEDPFFLIIVFVILSAFGILVAQIIKGRYRK